MSGAYLLQKTGFIKLVGLDEGPHCAVEDKDALLQLLFEQVCACHVHLLPIGKDKIGTSQQLVHEWVIV